MEIKDFVSMMDSNKELQKDLFIRGFLITDKEFKNIDKFPFYGNWKVNKVNDYYFMYHELTRFHIYIDNNGTAFFIMGHAYNPFTMEYEEEVILKDISKYYGTEKYIDKFNEITGVFVYGTVDRNGKVEYYTDPSGMQSACYGKIGNNFYISSHPQLIGDICDLKMDDFVKKLVVYKWYGRVMGPYLPGDLSPFKEVKRIVPSIKYNYDKTVSHKRYWPLNDAPKAVLQADYDKVIREAADILKNNMELITKKWSKPWISLTGGIDSNTTFAAGNGNYDKFETFSYISAEKEVRDADAAKKIADHFGLKHHLYNIPDNNSDIENFSNKLELLKHNNGYVADLKENEARKRMFLKKNAECDVEVKSWVSETIRVYT